jgi:hypothetical protein
MGKHITDYLLYARRYVLGYTLIGVAVVGLLLMAGLFIPGGLSQEEMNSVVKSSAVSLDTLDPVSIVNLPYHMMQRASMELFGITQVSIKLPSLILGAFTALGMVLLLRTWFQHNVAIITIVLVITTGQFLFIAQNGTPSIVYMFWSVWLLVSAMMVSRHAKFGLLWKLVLAATAALSLYTPLSFYILVALASALVLHPHLRYIARKLSKLKIAIGSLFALLLLAPLGYAIIKEPSAALTLLGIPSSWPDILGNTVQLLRQYFDFASPSSGTLMLPVYGLGSMILIALGIIHLVTTKYTARSYIISAWIILLLPILILNPRFTSVTFVPILLLMAMGIYMLLRNWYRLFPRNPYARIAGLIPLAVLIGGMVLSGVNRYNFGYLYDPKTASYFSQDLAIINKQLTKADRGSTAVIVSKDEVPFYTVVAENYKNVAINPATTSKASTTIVSHGAHKTTKPGVPSQILTTSDMQGADRFYVYKTTNK